MGLQENLVGQENKIPFFSVSLSQIAPVLVWWQVLGLGY